MLRVGRLALLSLFSVAFWHCGGGATGIAACRDIESKKCELLLGCPAVPIADANDVDACKLFYRDQCLHGLADSADPAPVAVSACLAAIDRAATCKAEPLGSCATAPLLAAGQDAQKLTGCDAMLATEALADCAFLSPANGAGGAGGANTGAATGGAGGSGGGG